MLLGYLAISLALSWVTLLVWLIYVLAALFPIFSGLNAVPFVDFSNVMMIIFELAILAGIGFVVGTDRGSRLVHRLGLRLCVILVASAFILTVVVIKADGPYLHATLGTKLNPLLYQAYIPHARAVTSSPAVPVPVLLSSQSYVALVHRVFLPIAIATTLLWLSYRHRQRAVAAE